MLSKFGEDETFKMRLLKNNNKKKMTKKNTKKLKKKKNPPSGSRGVLVCFFLSFGYPS